MKLRKEDLVGKKGVHGEPSRPKRRWKRVKMFLWGTSNGSTPYCKVQLAVAKLKATCTSPRLYLKKDAVRELEESFH